MKNSGQSLVELLVAVALSTILLPAIFSGFAASREGRVQQNRRLVATAYLQEVKAAVRSIREDDWDNVATNGVYHPEISSGQWILVAGTEDIADVTRSITIGDVFRDTSGQIVFVGGVIDPSTKEVVIDVSWPSVFPSAVSSTMYLTRYLDNQIYIETLEADFDAGTPINAVVTNNSGGEVELGSGGTSNWCQPNISIDPLDLPKSGVANAISAIEGGVFAGTGNNAAGVSFANVEISNTSPPVATLLDTFDGFKTNDVFGEVSFAYLATDTPQKEIAIIDLTSPYSEVGFFNSPGPTNAESVFVSGTTGYMTAGNTFYIFDLTSKIGDRSQLGSASLAGTGKSIVVVGTYAYVAIDSSSPQLQIVDVSNPAAPTVVGSGQVDGSDGVDVFVNQTQTRAYLVTEDSGSQNELFVVDVTSKAGSQPTIGSYNSNGMNPKGVTVVPGNRAIIVGNGAEEYQVVDTSNEAALIRCGGLEVDTGVNGIASILETDGDAYSYIITGDTASELKIIAGGPGGSALNSGEFESVIFDAGAMVSLNRFDATFIEPANTDIKFQIGMVDAVAGSCVGVSLVYTGPDGDIATFYEDSGSIASDNDSVGYENPAQCFGYKVFFESLDLVSTAVLQDMTINYSP